MEGLNGEMKLRLQLTLAYLWTGPELVLFFIFTFSLFYIVILTARPCLQGERVTLASGLP